METTYHSMTRRAAAHDYSRPGTYHITLHVAEGRGCPLGAVVGDPLATDGSPEAPRVELSPAGQMVEHELLTAIHARYPMVDVQDHVVMPDHLHALIKVTAPLKNKAGRGTHLGQVIAGFKYGCTMKYRALLANRPSEPADTLTAGWAGTVCPVVPPLGAKPVLFQEGYCDVMPVDAAQLETQRAYIHGNPRSRLLRQSHRDRLTTQRGAIPTALTVSALAGYLRRQCAASQATPEALAAITAQLLTLYPSFSPASLCPSVPPAGPVIVCDSYGDRSLLQRRLLPVVCHRKDKPRFAEQKQRCLAEAQDGTVLVSPRIAKGEQEILDEAAHHGLPVVILRDNGFPDRYHPSAAQLDRCAAGRLLLVSPWRYEYRPKGEALTVAECKTLNCVTQALCRQDDSWWKAPTIQK